MLQFNKSLATNTNALYLDTVNTNPGYYDSLRIAYSQSYDQSNGTFVVTATSLPTAYRNYLIIQNGNDVVPAASGQYNIELYTTAETDATWGTTTSTWKATSALWSEIEGDIALVELLYSDRAFVSGSNESSITTYVSSNEDAAYTTYNG